MFKWLIPLPALKKDKPNLQHTPTEIGMNPREQQYFHNMEEYARITYDLQYEALQKSLIYMHRTVVISLIAVVVSMGAVAVAIVLK